MVVGTGEEGADIHSQITPVVYHWHLNLLLLLY